MRKIVLFALASLAFLSAIAQQKTVVTGKVKATEDGLEIPGVSVVVKGTAVGTTTDASGNFSVEVPANATTLVFSFIGMMTQEVEISGRSVVDVFMSSDVKQLTEVVVVGYGTQDQQNITGSISKIKGSDIQNLPITSYEQALQGRTPGVEISSASGEVGAAMRIRVRGSSSVTANNQPLIVIDGFIVTTSDQSNFVDNNASNPMADLNPNDIASVEILKDASAAAIYGSRASNGVILITTKRGSKGVTKINFNYSTGTSRPTHLRTFLNNKQYVEMFTEAAKNSGYTTDPAGLDQAWYDYGGASSFTYLTNRGTNEDWNSAAYRVGRISQYDVSATGGNDKTQFFASLGYLDQTGIIVQNNLNRISARLNVDQAVSNTLKFGLSINQIYSYKINTPENNVFNSPTESNALSPILAIHDQTGDFNDSTYYANPFRAIANSKDRSTQMRNFSNIYGSWDIVKGLNFRSEAGVDILALYEYGWQGSKFPSSAGTPSSGKYGTSRVINYNINNTLNYTKDLNDFHSIQFMLGQSFQKSTSESSFQQGNGLPTDNFQYLANAATNTSFNSSATGFAYVSYFGRLNYKFANRYIVSGSLRNDGSSRFGQNNKYGWFPAVSVGWILTEEPFIKNMGIDRVLNFLKLKASIGKTGNSEITNFASRGLYTSTYFGSKAGLYPTQIANNDLSWEKTTQSDIGVEYTVANNRITGGVDYFVKNTNDLLLALPLPTTSGYLSSVRNLGKMTNKGWDIYITTRNLVGKFKWTTTFNISTYQNRVTDLSGQQILPSGRSLNAALVGQPLGVFYGVVYAGVDPHNGDALFKLADGTTTNNWSKASQTSNFQILGSPNPVHYGGINNTFEFMNFDLTVFGQWSYGNKILHSSGIFQSSGFTGFALDNQTLDMLHYWKQEGDITNVPRPELDMNNGARTTSRYVHDGSYFRFKTITLGYTIPKDVLNRLKISSCKIYVTGQNLFTLTKYQGNDPEINYTPPGSTNQTLNLTNGVDYYSAPQAKSLIFGVKLGF